MKSATHLSFFKLILSLVLLTIIALSPVTAFSQTLEELEEKQQMLENQIDENKHKLEENEEKVKDQKQNVSEIESELNKYNSKIDVLDAEISDLQNEIDSMNSDIDTLDSEINNINLKITEIKITAAMQEEKIKATRQKLTNRLVSSYMAGDSSILQILLGVDSLSELLTRTQILRNISQHEKKLIDSLKNEIEELNEMNSQLVSAIDTVNIRKNEIREKQSEVKDKQEAVQVSVDELENEKKSVEQKRREAVALLKTLDSQSDEYKKVERMLIAEQEKVDAEIDRMLLQNGSDENSNNFDNKDTPFIFPLKYTPSQCYTSAGYGQYPSGGSHYGVDMCVRHDVGKTNGAEIVASKSGKVFQARNHSTMGNYVIIDHGNGYNTVYMHCSVLKVSEGQTVQQGQTIGLVGKTGNTSGYHLHFEVRVRKGDKIIRDDPGKYITIPAKM